MLATLNSIQTHKSTMYFFDLNILALQLLPPSWRVIKETVGTITTERNSGQMNYLKAVLKPFKLLLQDFHTFREQAKSKVNLSAQVVVIEHHIEQLTGIRYGIFVSDEAALNHFSVNVPVAGQTKEKEIIQFLQKVVPAGRKHQLIFY